MKIVIKVLIVLIVLMFYKNTHSMQGINIYDIDSCNDIKYICTYDYCDYLRSNNFKESIEIFMNKYLSLIKDEEIKNTLKVKGVTITKIVKKR